ncbi:MAG: diaminopimelate decarboxylase [Armatimonadota bacterium]
MYLGTQRVNAAGHLEIGGCDTIALAREFGTPLYVMDEALIRENCRRYAAVFAARYPGESRVSYAGKAFLVLAIACLVAQEGLDIDVASGGELHTVLTAGFPADRVLYHGNYKSDEEIAMGLDAGVGRFIVDNPHELRRLSAAAAQRGIVQSILLRVTPGIDPHTHRRIRTGQEDSKFGVNISDGSALAVLKEAAALPGIDLKGVHCHVGSQLHDAASHIDAIDVMVGLLATYARESGTPLSELDLGGGLGVRYLPTHQPPSYEDFAESLCSALEAAFAKHGLTPPVLLQEPGRSLVAEAGTTLYTTGPAKTVGIPEEPGTRTYVAVDGGMSDNPRPQLYDAVYSCLVANRAEQPRDRIATIAGKHCETDILIWNTPVGEIRDGDILAVQTTGAYNHAMASNYNRFRRPPVVLVNEGHADVIFARESWDDVIRQDRIPDRLR